MSSYRKAIEDQAFTYRHTPEGAGNINAWKKRHAFAYSFPSNRFEGTIGNMLRAIADYADMHEERYESKIGDDGFIGPHWKRMIDGLRGLLNGDCGNLDCGTIDGHLCDMLKAEGLSDE